MFLISGEEKVTVRQYRGAVRWWVPLRGGYVAFAVIVA